ncbi:hypothetical protein ACFL0W_05810 [Nanoarchaeota archaeon]
MASNYDRRTVLKLAGLGALVGGLGGCAGLFGGGSSQRTDSNEPMNVLYLVIEEFSDFLKTKWDFVETYPDRTTKAFEFTEPADYTTDKFQAVLNPKFKDKSDIDSAYLTRPIMYGTDNIEFRVINDPHQIFEILKNYDSKKLDRLIINAHGHDNSMGQERPTETYVRLEDLAERYDKSDFSNLMAQGGHVLLEACSTMKDYEKQLTIGEYVSWLLQTPVTAPIEDAIMICTGLSGPNSRWSDSNKKELYVNWRGNPLASDYPSAPKKFTSTKFVTVHPESNDELVQLELQERLLRPQRNARIIPSATFAYRDYSVRKLQDIYQRQLVANQKVLFAGRDTIYKNTEELRKYIQVRTQLEEMRSN